MNLRLTTLALNNHLLQRKGGLLKARLIAGLSLWAYSRVQVEKGRSGFAFRARTLAEGSEEATRDENSI